MSRAYGFIIFLVFIPAILLRTQFDFGRYVVSQDNAPLYDTFAGSSAVDFAPFLLVFKARAQRGTRIQLDYKGRELWIEMHNVIKMDFNSRNFSDSSTDFIETKLVGNILWFAYKKALYAMDLSDINMPVVQKKAELPSVSDAQASEDRTLWLLSGESSYKNERNLRLALFSVPQKRFVPLTMIYGNNMSLLDAAFSADNRFVAVHTDLQDAKKLTVFSTSNGILEHSLNDVDNFFWYGNSILIFRKHDIILFDPSQPDMERTILYASPKQRDTIEYRQVGERLLIAVDGVVYILTNSNLQKTDFKSIDRSPDGSLEHFEEKGSTYTLYKGKQLRALSGSKPRWEFDSFLGNNYIVYREKKGSALTTLYLYDPKKDISLSYYWVEEPSQILNDGLAIEAVNEKNDVWFFLEKPGETAKILRLSEIIK